MKSLQMIVPSTLLVVVGMLVNGCGGGGGGTINPPISTYAVSGSITSGGAALAGVTVALSGNGTTTTTTSNSGSYSFANAANGSYTVTPSLPGYSFDPASRSITVNSADLPAQNFTGTQQQVATYAVTPVVGTNGSMTPATFQTVTSGSVVTFTITPNNGYVASVSGCGGSLSGTTYTTGVITSACTVTASFSPISTPVTAAILLPKTGQTASFLAADDGALQRGVAWPNPRFSDKGDGTVTDNLTGLIWLKDANCTDTVLGISKTSGFQFWHNALTWSNGLAAPECNLTDGSTAGDWRLPNVNELESLVDLSHISPALPSDHLFTGVQFNRYWTSTTYYKDLTNTADALYVDMAGGGVNFNSRGSFYYVLPVRGGQ